MAESKDAGIDFGAIAEVIGKILNILLFALVSVVFLPAFLIVYFGMPLYEDWYGKILKL